jgi:predicted RNase H-like HicB family nuclease
MREYLVIYEKGGSGWGAYAPDLPGLGATGKTLEEVKKLISEGIEFHLESLLEHGDPVPEPQSHAGTVRTEVCEVWESRLVKSA